MAILLCAGSMRRTKAVDVSPLKGCIPKNCSSIWSRERPNCSSTSLVNAYQVGNGPLTYYHPRPPKISGSSCSMWSYLNCHSKDANDGSNNLSARAALPQNAVRSLGSGRTVSARGISYVLSSLMMWAGMWSAAVVRLNVALGCGGGAE